VGAAARLIEPDDPEIAVLLTARPLVLTSTRTTPVSFSNATISLVISNCSSGDRSASHIREIGSRPWCGSV
jgi:hypothetical protein